MGRLPSLRHTVATVAVAVALGGCAGRCGARGGLPPPRMPVFTGADGQKYHLLDKGPYKAYYDRWGRLQRLEYDSNRDGRADQIALHDGAKVPREIQVDQDFDGQTDRWERYAPSGELERVGTTSVGGRPDKWAATGTDGSLARMEYDQDGDGKIERAELIKDGVVSAVEIDADRDGRIDRWQAWEQGRLQSETLDTDADGAPDRRIRYDTRGRVAGLEPLTPR